MKNKYKYFHLNKISETRVLRETIFFYDRENNCRGYFFREDKEDYFKLVTIDIYRWKIEEIEELLQLMKDLNKKFMKNNLNNFINKYNKLEVIKNE